MLCQSKDGGEGRGGDGADEKTRGKDVQADDVPEGAQQNVRQRRMGVGELRNQPAVMVEVQRRGDVIAALVPVVGKAKQREMAERNDGEEQEPEQPGGQSGEAGGDARGEAPAWRT
jgi:hypothetical protein